MYPGVGHRSETNTLSLHHLGTRDSVGCAGHILEARMEKSCWGGSRAGGGTRKPSGKEMKMQEKLGKRPRTSGWGLAETASHACIWNFARLGAMPTQSKRHRIRYLASVCMFWSQTPPRFPFRNQHSLPYPSFLTRGADDEGVHTRSTCSTPGLLL